MDISVCIPTHERPGFAEKAIQSCLTQHLLPYEILVGDDSPDDRTAEVVRQYADFDDVKVRYFHNRPGLGQAKNVDSLFQRARGDTIVLLHDDDLLLPNALSDLADCFHNNPQVVAAYGKQQVITHDGTLQSDTTQRINEGYYRTEDYEGVQPSTLRSAVTQQFPNDGYMVDAATAKKVGYVTEGMGDACDFAFGVEFARHTTGDFYYKDTFTSQYRWSEQSIVRGGQKHDTAYRAFKMVIDDLSDEVETDPYVQDWLRRRSPVAVMIAAQHGFTQDGFRWFFGPYHRHRILSLGGMRRLLTLLNPRKWYDVQFEFDN